MKPWIFRTATVLTMLACSGGCLAVRMRERVIREDEQRRPLHFQSFRAQERFQRLALDGKTRRKTGSHQSLTIPFVVFTSDSSVLSENAYYNDQAASCDADGDGLLSDEEVAEYSYRKAKDADASDDEQPAQVASDKQPAVRTGFLRGRRAR